MHPAIKLFKVASIAFASLDADSFRCKNSGIDTLELETDPITLELKKRRLEKPLQAGVRIVLTQNDINRALRSPFVTARLKNLGIRLLPRREARQVERYDFLNPQLMLLPQKSSPVSSRTSRTR